MITLALAMISLAAPVDLSFDGGKVIGPISEYIYGTNRNLWTGADKYLTLGRQGGNRMTAYNWENNASNAGNDYHFQSDGFLGGGDIPGEVPRAAVAAAQAAGKAFIVTVPMAGYVSKDKKADGDVRKTPDYLNVRFDKSVARKNAPFVYPPDRSDHTVYQDEFVHWLEGKFKDRTAPIWYDLDNEPDIWSGTHAEVHPSPTTYAEMVQKTRDYGSMIKSIAPQTQVFGFVSYGWNGYRTLQNAPDGNGRDFIDFFLSSMKDVERTTGKRVMDVLDLHWYPEAKGGGVRVTEASAAPEVVAAREQATRSLWDPTYTENSWIADTLKEPIRLIPRIKEKIAKFYPGTKLAFTEYQFGGGNDISGAIAEADALGIFGREGVFAACLWPLSSDAKFTDAGFSAFRDYDGRGAHFGDMALSATSSDPAHVSIYASKFGSTPGKYVLVVVNQDAVQRVAKISIPPRAGSLKAYLLTSIAPTIRKGVTLSRVRGQASMILPAQSVTTIELGPGAG